MAVILTHPAARDLPSSAPRPRLAAAATGRRRWLPLLGLAPLLLAAASWDAVTFLGGTGAHALPAAHASASACA